jgi:hypothetical protein
MPDTSRRERRPASIVDHCARASPPAADSLQKTAEQRLDP